MIFVMWLGVGIDFRTRLSLDAQLAVAHQHARMPARKWRRALGEVHRAVAAAGAADARPSDSCGCRASNLGQPALDEAADVVEQRLHAGVALEELDHRRVAAGSGRSCGS